MLPGALAPDACAEMRDKMWDEITAVVPRLDRHDPKTWTPFSADESPSKRRPEFNNSHEGGDVRFECGPGYRYFLRNGTDEHHLDFFPRALWDVAEQLLGRGELTYPRGEVDGKISGPCFMDASTESGLATHTASEPRWPPPLATQELEITATGPGFMNGQGTRGLYCTMPNSSDPREAKHSDTLPYAGMHSDGGVEGRIRLRATAFIDDCPPGCGGFTIWRGSHFAMWKQQWQDLQKANSHIATKSEAELEAEWEEGVRSGLTYRQRIEQRKGYDGYHGEVMDALREQSPVEVSGPAGTVVLWVGVTAHIVGQNKHSDIIRQASICKPHYALSRSPSLFLSLCISLLPHPTTLSILTSQVGRCVR